MATIIIAVWGAVVATIAIIWNIYVSVNKIKVNCYTSKTIPNNRHCLTFYIVNTGNRPLVIHNVGGSSINKKHIDWQQINNDTPLPKKLHYSEYILVSLPLNKDLINALNDTKSLWAEDTLRNKYKISKKSIKKIKSDISISN